MDALRRGIAGEAAKKPAGQAQKTRVANADVASAGRVGCLANLFVRNILPLAALGFRCDFH